MLVLTIILATDSQVLDGGSYLDIISLVKYTRFSEQSCFECSILVQKICYWVCILRKEMDEEEGEGGGRRRRKTEEGERGGRRRRKTEEGGVSQSACMHG